MCATFKLHFFPVSVEEQITWSKGSQRDSQLQTKCLMLPDLEEQER